MKLSAARWLIASFALPALAATISIQPANLTATPGQSFSLNVNASNVSDLYAFQFDLRFTPGVLLATDISEGSFLKSGGATVFIPGVIDNLAGTISFTADTLVGAVPGVDGSGTVATVQFKALAPGTSSINLSNIILLDSALADVAATGLGGGVNVVPEPTTTCLLVVGVCLFLLFREGRGLRSWWGVQQFLLLAGRFAGHRDSRGK